MVRIHTFTVLQIVISFNCIGSGRCSSRHRLFKRLQLFCLRPSIIPQIITRILDFCMVLWNLQSLIPLPCCHIPQSIAKISVLPPDLWNLSSHLPILFHRLVPEHLLSIIVCGILHIEKERPAPYLC